MQTNITGASGKVNYFQADLILTNHTPTRQPTQPRRISKSACTKQPVISCEQSMRHWLGSTGRRSECARPASSPSRLPGWRPCHGRASAVIARSNSGVERLSGLGRRTGLHELHTAPQAATLRVAPPRGLQGTKTRWLDEGGYLPAIIPALAPRGVATIPKTPSAIATIARSIVAGLPM